MKTTMTENSQALCLDGMNDGRRLSYAEPKSVVIEFELENAVLGISGNLPDQNGEDWDH